jgi:DNA-binding NarL/FixJ family response regulator
MEKGILRVMVASGNPKVRQLLKEALEVESEITVVVEVDNAVDALASAGNTKPDVAVIDFNLPHAHGLLKSPLSDIGGLDTAQTIGANYSKTLVVLVTDFNATTVSQSNNSCPIAEFCMESPDGYKSFSLKELQHKVTSNGRPIFARIQLSSTSGSERSAGISTKANLYAGRTIVFGGFSIIAGIVLFFTIILAPLGLFLAAAGAITVLLGLAGKLVINFPGLHRLNVQGQGAVQ